MNGKLNIMQIRWILREHKKGELTTDQIADQQRVTTRRVRQLVVKYADTPPDSIRIGKPGARPKPISLEEVKIVHLAKRRYGLGAVNLEKVIAAYGAKIPHNRVHRILKQEGLAKTEPKKSKKRKWVRWERRYSNRMWHTDYTESDYGTQIILYEDDASRYVVGHEEFLDATTDNAIRVFDKAVAKWGLPDELLTDHGSQFCEDENKEYRFRKHIESYGVKHILARVKHPQTNGKQEKLGGTIKKIMRDKKCGLDEAVAFYNEVRPHMSLDNGRLRTPLVAYYEKMKPDKRYGSAYQKGLERARELGLNKEFRVELERLGLVKPS